MKKAMLYIVASSFLYSYFYELNPLRVALLILGLASIFVVSRLPLKVVLGAKYPVILLSFAGSAGFFFYPQLGSAYPVEPLVIFLALYSIAFYLTTMDEKGMDLYKELAGLSMLILSASFNLAMLGKPVLILPLVLSAMVFLLILGRYRFVALLAAYSVIITVVMVYKHVAVFSGSAPIGQINRYLLFATSFVFLVISFIGFVKQGGRVKIFSFFGFLYVSIDLLLTTGLRISGGLLYEPVLALFVISPFIGLMLKSEAKGT